jgi:hypothetical protein
VVSTNSQGIDRGLTECRHAVLVVTPNLLTNESWARTELASLLTRAVANPGLIIPVWSLVDRESVAARSTLLANIVALLDANNMEDLASRIYVAVGGPEGRVAQSAAL